MEINRICRILNELKRHQLTMHRDLVYRKYTQVAVYCLGALLPFEIFQNSASTLPLCNFFLIHNLQSHFQYQECLLQLSKFSFLHKKAKYFWQYVTNWTFSCSYFIYNLYSYWTIWKYFDMFISEISSKTSQGVMHS